MATCVRRTGDEVMRRVAYALLLHPFVDYCSACLASQLALEPAEVAQAMGQLSVLPRFLRDRWICRVCGAEAIVIRAISAPTASTA